MAFVFVNMPQQNRLAAKPIMESKKKSPIATLCILLFHLGLLYWAYQQIAPEKQPNPTTQQEIQNDTP